jgi:hypothetical protein
MTTNVNPLEQLGQGAHHDSLQTLVSHLVDMHRLTSKIEKVMKFQR